MCCVIELALRNTTVQKSVVTERIPRFIIF